jgi:beta-glucosidase
MLGCYSFPMHVGVHHPDVPMGLPIPTVLEAMRAHAAGYRVTYAQGCPVLGGDDADIAAAAKEAATADVCVAVLGDQAGLFGGGTSGEGCDVVDLRLPGRQEELLEALIATGTPVVVVLLVGRPYDLSRQLPRLAGVLCGFFPGAEGGPALADILAGRVNPSGRLPVGFPSASAAQPGTYLSAPLGQRNEVSSVDPTPLFPFGHGLSYAPLTWSAIEQMSPSDWPTDGTCEIAVTLANETDRVSSEVVQVYLRDPIAEVVRPVQQLIGAARVDLAPGERARVTFRLHADLTSFTGRSGVRIVEPGRIDLRVGASSGDIRQVLELSLVGARREVGFDRALAPEIVVESPGDR